MIKDIKSNGPICWPTLLLIVTCYTIWLASLWFLPLLLGVPVAGLAIALHASLQHEVIHGHPTRWQRLNDALICLPLNLVIPYERFRATHLAHHNDATLTDPYDDPETYYLATETWARLPGLLQRVLRINNTLAGRLALGPIVGQVAFLLSEWCVRDGNVIRGWVAYLPAALVVLAVVIMAPMPLWAYLIAAYLGLALLKLRTFLEHQAHERASGRSVIIEDRGLFALLFLNNNLHVVHHMHPKVPWYVLPALYRARRDHYLRRNGGYMYPSYGAILKQYLWRAKEPVAHPLWRRD
ncbi:fatty acid desaturase [Loktanella agnita]|uniref:fatty acid desaturase n=1 Tax=Loktanella agnita TaxID=287097 RepID=UPI0039883777